MRYTEHVPLSDVTTLRIGGDARYLYTCASVHDVYDALSFAKEQNLPWRVLGGGSNILAPDEGFVGVVLHMTGQDITWIEGEEGTSVTASAGVAWDTLVQESVEQGLWGLENLAGIPGTVGAAPVQNIGAYGVEVQEVITAVEVLDTHTNEVQIWTPEQCSFEYRESVFKHNPHLIILSVSFALSEEPMPRLSYKDIAARVEAGEVLDTSVAVARVVREIRAAKFPDLAIVGTAGSFFKNPVITYEQYAALAVTYPELPSFPVHGGVKIPLAFVLDKVLGLRGYQAGSVALFEKQPLVLIAYEGATAQEIDVFANDIAQRVYDATHIMIEREVRSW